MEKILDSYNYENSFPPGPICNPSWTFLEAKIVDIYDGDSVSICVQNEEKTQVWRLTLRLAGIDAPEIKVSKNLSPRKREFLKSYALKSRNFIIKRALESEEDFSKLSNSELREKLGKSKIRFSGIIYGKDKYGRFITDLYHRGESLSQVMIENGLAVKYQGKTRMSYEDWLEMS